MRAIDRVEIRSGEIYDFLSSIYRLTNNERLIEHFKELTPGYRPVGEIIDWIVSAARRTPETIREKMDLYFNWQAPLGMRVSHLISERDLSKLSEFFEEVSGVSARDMLRDFLLIGLGPRTVGFDESIIEALIEDQEKALVFLAERAVLTPHQKAIMLEFFADPNSMKEDFLYLLQWYAEHIFPSVPYSVREIGESVSALKKNLADRGEEYLLKLIDNMHYEELREERKVILAVSYFVENAQGGVFHPLAKNDLFIVGYKLISSVLEETPLHLTALRFKALGNEKRLRLLNTLFGKRYTGYDLSRKLKMSNAEVTESFSSLVVCGLVRTYRTSDGIYFTADRQEVIELLSRDLKPESYSD